MSGSLLDRLLAGYKVDDTTGCWAWQNSKSRTGYARIQVGRKNKDAHKVAYELLVGAIPNGLELDHLCRNRACINPKHLEPVTRRENVIRGISFAAVNANKSHCIHGHAFDDENTYIRPNGHRGCRRCNEDAVARYILRQSA